MGTPFVPVMFHRDSVCDQNYEECLLPYSSSFSVIRCFSSLLLAKRNFFFLRGCCRPNQNCCVCLDLWRELIVMVRLGCVSGLSVLQVKKVPLAPSAAQTTKSTSSIVCAWRSNQQRDMSSLFVIQETIDAERAMRPPFPFQVLWERKSVTV